MLRKSLTTPTHQNHRWTLRHHQNPTQNYLLLLLKYNPSLTPLSHQFSGQSAWRDNSSSNATHTLKQKENSRTASSSTPRRMNWRNWKQNYKVIWSCHATASASSPKQILDLQTHAAHCERDDWWVEWACILRWRPWTQVECRPKIGVLWWKVGSGCNTYVSRIKTLQAWRSRTQSDEYEYEQRSRI